VPTTDGRPVVDPSPHLEEIIPLINIRQCCSEEAMAKVEGGAEEVYVSFYVWTHTPNWDESMQVQPVCTLPRASARMY
jgi:hypothetical protein